MSNRSNSETSNLKVFLKCREFPGIPFGHLGCAKVSGSRVSFSKHGHTTKPSRSSWDPQFSQGPNSDIPMHAVMWNDVNVADATRVSFKSGSSADPKPGQLLKDPISTWSQRLAAIGSSIWWLASGKGLIKQISAEFEYLRVDDCKQSIHAHPYPQNIGRRPQEVIF